MKCRQTTIVGTVGIACICTALASAGPAAATDAASPFAWPPVTRQARPWAYWWWMGSAVNRDDLTRNLQQLRAAGMGGVHVIPIYGARGYEDQYIEYLSPTWLTMLGHAVRQGQRLDMGVDMTTGSGWCFGGPGVSDRDANAKVVLETRAIETGKPLRGSRSRDELQAVVAWRADQADGQVVLLTDRVARDGTIQWTVPPGDWRLSTVSQRPSGRMVKRAAPGGAGPMLNPFYGQAVEHYLARFDQALRTYRGPLPRAMYHDSFEYVSDWSPDLLDQFQQRRGYRLQTQLPALLGRGPAGRVARVKCDYRETISDMMLDRFITVWVRWAHGHGCRTRNQAHGSPGNLLDLYAAADIPETEMFHSDRDPLVSKFASSAAHVAGRQLVAAETGTWLGEHFTVTLGQMKRLVDQLFLAGVNHVVYHGSCYSPAAAPWPGWLFYASTQMNPRNAIWHDAPALNGYIARCQSILQSGRPANDVLLYWPIHDLWSDPTGLTRTLTVHRRQWLTEQPIGRVARWLWDRGYLFDYVSDRQLKQTRMCDGRIRTPGGSYRAIVVPACRRMPVATMRRLRKLAEAGAAVVFEDHLPSDVPGWGRVAERRALLRATCAGLAAPGNNEPMAQTETGQGRVFIGRLDAALPAAGVPRESMVDRPGLRAVRRVEAAGHLYFIVNQGQSAFRGWVPLATPAKGVVMMDPMTGKVGVAAFRMDKGRLQVRLQLAADGAIILRTIEKSEVQGPRWPYFEPVDDSVQLAGPWQVQFIQGGPVTPDSCRMDRLVSWTELKDPRASCFAGTARYTLRLDAPNGQTGPWQLDLGRVAESARLRLNGENLGTLIIKPFSVRIDRLKPKGNVLEIEVTNLSANRIRDLDRRKVVWKNFHDINFVNIEYKPFDSSNWPLRASGLLGPVRLTRVELDQ